MSGKKRKSQTPWSACDYCQVIISQRDSLLHKEKSCPPNLKNWAHSFIKDDKLYTTVETFQLDDKSVQLVPKENRNDFVLIPYHALQLCKIPIGDPVVIKTEESIKPFVKLAWPIQKEEKTSDFTIALCNEDLSLNNLKPKDLAMVHQIQENLKVAKLVTLTSETNLSVDIANLLSRIEIQNVNKIYCVGNRLSVKLLGFQFIFKIGEILPLTDDQISESFHLITSETKWKIYVNDTEQINSTNMLNKLGGLNSIISDLKDVISLALNKNDYDLSHKILGLLITRGILIYGPGGTGKSTLIEALAEHFTNNIIRVEGAKIFNKFLGETEKELTNCFEKAKQMSPSVILIDDLDVLCAKSNSSSDHEKRITATLSLLMDKLNQTVSEVVVMATTSKIDQIDRMLRCPSRFGKEVEIHVPSSPQRFEIMSVLLENINHNMDHDDIKNIADSSHGFVGADLVSLVSKAVLKNYKNTQGKEQISLYDFQWALSKVKPSAMKEIMIEVPNLKWSDIGGQDDLKLKLQQCVEWPLKYSQSFSKLGITPPKGLLMFGPPGCSKTMIAKALASESQLNFISVKGPELFSKWVGESERAVRTVFQRARQTAPSIIFFDELDAIGGERNSSSGSNVQERVLAQILTELDGVEPLNNVTVIAATNRLDRIDPALIRPGRLDRIIYVPLPDAKTRHEIFKLQLQKTCISADVNVQELVERTDGYSGAEIVAVCREAALKALEENLEAELVERKHFLEAFTIVVPRTPKSLLDMYDKYLLK